MEVAADIALWIVPILLAVVLHEVSHGWVANRLGDPTAAERGRLTLNPIRHVDPLGTIVVPLLLVLMKTGFVFGWAKPVPIDYRRLGNPRRDMVLVAAAGPLANFTIAAVAAALAHAAKAFAGSDPGVVVFAFLLVAQATVATNVFLGIFNLLPIPPLDGGRVVTGLLPLALARRYARVEPFGILVVFGLLAFDAIGPLVTTPALVIIRFLLA
jgi:Zn-dependent protease